MQPQPTEDPDPALTQLRGRRIDQPYTIFNRITLVRDARGTLWFPELWAKDLCLHLVYLKDMRLCCPVQDGIPPADFVSAVTQPELRALKVVPMRADHGWLGVLRNLVPNFLSVARAVEHSEVLHSGAAGWPFPPSYYLLALRLFKRRKWVFLVESTFWHLTKHERPTLRRVAVSLASRFLVRRCAEAADVRIFTSVGYRDFLLSPEKRAYINNATWINREHCVSLEDARARWQTSLRHRHEARFVFAARLIPQKGAMLLMEAIRILNQRRVNLAVDFMGSGELERRCRAFAEEERGSVKLQFIEPITYGPNFFAKLAEYDAVLVPNLSDEQPRIPFDAFSQGVPVIASDTMGVREVVKDGVTGFLCPAGDAHALADLLERHAKAREGLRDAGLRALQWVSSRTHAAMHLERANILSEALKT
jgi:glycosyltransferase involved in cell wall biosynthesis